MYKNIFFERKGPFSLHDLFKSSKIKKKIFDIKDLKQATKYDLTFLDSISYVESLKSTKALFCLTTEKLKTY